MPSSSASPDSSDDFFSDFSDVPAAAALAAPAMASTTTRSSITRPPPPPPPKPAYASAAAAAAPSSYTPVEAATDATTTVKKARVPLVRKSKPITTASHAASTATRSLPTAAGTRPTLSYYSAGAPATNVTAAAPAAASFYPYAATPTAPANTVTPMPTVMNPYMLSNQKSTTNIPKAPSTGGLEGVMDGSEPTGRAFISPAPAGLTGPMDTSNGHNSFAQPMSFNYGKQAAAFSASGDNSNLSPNNYMDQYHSSFDDEPPLLEELGIHMDHIMAKTRAVVLPFQRFGGNMDATVIQDADLYGPLALALLLGGELLLSGKIQFGYIYGFGLFGCVSMTVMLNLMTPKEEAISMWTVTSILGYSLLPVNLLAAIKIVLRVASLTTLGRVLGITTVLWSTVAATRLMEQGCGMRDQRYLIAYPIALLYSAFVMMTIF
jgi:protein YIPF5/7